MNLIGAGVRCVPVSEGIWLAVIPTQGSAYRINDRTKQLIESLQGTHLMADAHGRYQSLTGHKLTSYEFLSSAESVIFQLTFQSRTARDQLTVGFTILPAPLFERLGSFFRSLINLQMLSLVCLLVPIGLWYGLSQASVDASLSVYGQGLAGLGLIMASVLFHEIGHAAALVRHGRGVGHLGAGINMIFPALFTEVLEHAAMSRREKLWLNVSGVYFQLIFAHAVMVYSILCAAHAARHYAVIIYLLSLFQLLPLNKQDGMWLVSDFMGVRGKKFRIATQALSLLLAGVLVYFLIDRVLVPYWQARIIEFSYSAPFFSGSASVHVSGLIGTAIVMVWAARIARAVLTVSGRRRTAHSSSRQY